MIQCSKNAKIFKKFQFEVGAIALPIAVTNMPLVLSLERNSIALWPPKGFHTFIFNFWYENQFFPN